jgi:N-acetylmuramoyl-L-alanine amidase
MRIANKKRFMGSCIFFTFLLSIFGKWSTSFEEGKFLKESSSPVVMAIDKNKITSSSKKLESKKDYIVVLDPGHGGIDFGTTYKNLNEKDLTLKIAKYAEQYLKDQGYSVVLTRKEDKLVPLKEIGDIANTAKGDVFVSIHINSIEDINYKGITDYYYDGKGYETDKRIKLAKTIGNEILKSDNWEDKGVKRENFAVLRYTKMPSALIECGFITNEEDRSRLFKNEVLKKLAQNISNGIIKYLDAEGKSGYNENSGDYTKLMVNEKTTKEAKDKKSTIGQNELKSIYNGNENKTTNKSIPNNTKKVEVKDKVMN